MKIKRIEISKLRENLWNPNKMDDAKFRALVKSISERGFVQPIIVRPVKKGKFEVLDGAHRLRALRELKKKHADCVVLEESGAAAKMRTLSMNRLRGEFDGLKLADLVGTMGMSHDEIAAALAFSERELAALGSLLGKIPDPDFEIPEEEGFVLLDFYLSPDEAKIVERALKSTGEKNPAKALVLLAKKAVK
jgi:ParB/RepB/Spo0J family partition protein